MAARPSREAVARWNDAYSEQTAALFAAMRASRHDVEPIRRLARGYLSVALAWRNFAADLAVPMWARHASVIAAEEFERRARLENTRADWASIEEQDP